MVRRWGGFLCFFVEDRLDACYSPTSFSQINSFADEEHGGFMKRQSARAIGIDTNVRCDRIYPTEDTKRTVADLQTVGIKLNKEQAIHMARVLLAVTQE
jgi:hypothetical protein